MCTLHAALVLSPVAHGRLRKLEVPQGPGVVAVLGPEDIPGKNDVAAVGTDEPLFAFDRVSYAGQPLAMVVATTLEWVRSSFAYVQSTGVAIAVTAFFGLAYLTIWSVGGLAGLTKDPPRRLAQS